MVCENCDKFNFTEWFNSNKPDYVMEVSDFLLELSNYILNEYNVDNLAISDKEISDLFGRVIECESPKEIYCKLKCKK